MTFQTVILKISALLMTLMVVTSAQASGPTVQINKNTVASDSILIVQKANRDNPKKARTIANYAVVIDAIQNNQITYRIFDTGAGLVPDTVQKQKAVTKSVADFEKEFVIARMPRKPSMTQDRTRVPKIGDLYRYKTPDGCRLYRLQATFPHGQGQSYLVYGDDNILRLIESMPEGAYQSVPDGKGALASCTPEKRVPEMLMKGGVLTPEPAAPERTVPSAPAGKSITTVRD